MGGHFDSAQMNIPGGYIFDCNYYDATFCLCFLSFGNYCQYRDTIYGNTITSYMCMCIALQQYKRETKEQ